MHAILALALIAATPRQIEEQARAAELAIEIARAINLSVGMRAIAFAPACYGEERACITMYYDPDWLQGTTPEAVARNKAQRVKNVGLTRYTLTTARSIGIDSSLDESMMRWVLLHEYGHALGLDHVADKNSVMRENVPRAPSESIPYWINSLADLVCRLGWNGPCPK